MRTPVYYHIQGFASGVAWKSRLSGRFLAFSLPAGIRFCGIPAHDAPD